VEATDSDRALLDEPQDRPRDQVVGSRPVVRRQAWALLLGAVLGAVVGLPAGAMLADAVAAGGRPTWWIVFLGAGLSCAALGMLVASYASLRPGDPHGGERSHG
jgi:hypothetical protein